MGSLAGMNHAVVIETPVTVPGFVLIVKPALDDLCWMCIERLLSSNALLADSCRRLAKCLIMTASLDFANVFSGCRINTCRRSFPLSDLDKFSRYDFIDLVEAAEIGRSWLLETNHCPHLLITESPGRFEINSKFCFNPPLGVFTKILSSLTDLPARFSSKSGNQSGLCSIFLGIVCRKRPREESDA